MVLKLYVSLNTTRKINLTANDAKRHRHCNMASSDFQSSSDRLHDSDSSHGHLDLIIPVTYWVFIEGTQVSDSQNHTWLLFSMQRPQKRCLQCPTCVT